MRYLIVKTSAIGDVIQCFPAIAYLKSKSPFAQIDWVVEEEAAELVKAHPLVDRVIVIRTKKWRKCWFSLKNIIEMYREVRYLRSTTYHVLFDLQGNIKSFFLNGLAKAYVKVGWKASEMQESIGSCFLNRSFGKGPSLNAREQNIHLLSQFFQDTDHLPALEKVELKTSPYSLPPKKSKKRYLISIGARWESKKVDPMKLVEGLQSLSQTHELYFVWGNNKEKNQCEAMLKAFKGEGFLLPKLTLLQLYDVMKQVDRALCMDSMPLHLAALAGTATLSFFGPSSPSVFAPKGNQHLSFQGSCPYGQKFEVRCPKLRSCATKCCIKKISPDQVEKFVLQDIVK
jgi:heptosyltransferase I